MGLDVCVFQLMDGPFSRRLAFEGDEYELIHSEWPTLDRIKPGAYRATRHKSFRAGSYSGYHDFRNMLSLAALGVPAKEVFGRCGDLFPTNTIARLIDFSDCEGCIGPETSAMLLGEMERYRDSFVAVLKSDHNLWHDDNGWYIGVYDGFVDAFRFAKENNGVVHFG